MKTTLPGALDFIRNATLPELRADRAASAVLDPVTDAAEHSAVLVGSAVMSFADNVSAARRGAFLNCTLFAELVANKNVLDGADLDKWYDSYFATLSELGFATQERALTTVAGSNDEFSAHSTILAVAAAFLGETTSAYALLVKALVALRKMDQSSPWIRIFSREAHTARTAKMQMGVVSDTGGDLSLSLLAFALTSNSEVIQVLFFKSRQQDVSFRECHGKTAIDAAILDGVQPVLRRKLLARAENFVLGLPDL